MNNNYETLMNSKPVVLITSEYTKPIVEGTLIGFKWNFSNDNDIKAAYPVWKVVGNEILFVLFWLDTGRPCIDNAWITSGEVFINEEPIVVDITVKNPLTFAERLNDLLNK